MVNLWEKVQFPASLMRRQKGFDRKRSVLQLIVNSCFPERPKRPLPVKPKNADVRPREYLRPEEVERVITAAKSVGRYPSRLNLVANQCSSRRRNARMHSPMWLRCARLERT